MRSYTRNCTGTFTRTLHAAGDPTRQALWDAARGFCVSMRRPGATQWHSVIRTGLWRWQIYKPFYCCCCPAGDPGRYGWSSPSPSPSPSSPPLSAPVSCSQRHVQDTSKVKSQGLLWWAERSPYLNWLLVRSSILLLTCRHLVQLNFPKVSCMAS